MRGPVTVKMVTPADMVWFCKAQMKTASSSHKALLGFYVWGSEQCEFWGTEGIFSDQDWIFYVLLLVLAPRS